MMRTRRALISSSVQKKLEKSCTTPSAHGVTPPAFANHVGQNQHAFSLRMSSVTASGVVGPLAPSIRAWP